MLGALFGGLVGGFVGAGMNRPSTSTTVKNIHIHKENNKKQFESIKQDFESIKKDLENIKAFNAICKRNQENVVISLNKLKEIMELNVRLSLMSEEEKLLYRQFLIQQELEEKEAKYQKEMENRIEKIINSRKNKLYCVNERFENREYILDLIDICYCLFAYYDEKDSDCCTPYSLQICEDEVQNLTKEIAKKHHLCVYDVKRDSYNLFNSTYNPW